MLRLVLVPSSTTSATLCLTSVQSEAFTKEINCLQVLLKSLTVSVSNCGQCQSAQKAANKIVSVELRTHSATVMLTNSIDLHRDCSPNPIHTLGSIFRLRELGAPEC